MEAVQRFIKHTTKDKKHSFLQQGLLLFNAFVYKNIFQKLFMSHLDEPS